MGKILPLLMDTKCRLFTAAINGSITELCKFMVVSNKSVKDLMKIDEDTNNTILHRICTKGRSKAFSFILSILSKQEIIDYLFQSNNRDYRPYEYAVSYSSISITKKIFDIKEIQEKISNNDDNLYRLFYHVFVYNQNKYLIDYIISVLNITKEKMATIIGHKSPAPPYGKFASDRVKYDLRTIVGAISMVGTAKNMKHLANVIGNELLCDHIFVKDGWGWNAIKYAIYKKKLQMIKCILSIKPVKEKLLTDDDELGPALKTLSDNFEESVAKYLVNELELNETRLNELDQVYSLNVNKILSLSV